MSIKKINIFIGSSIEELKPERDELMRFIQGLNNKYVDRGYFFHGYVCEETPNMMREGGSQALHDEFIRDKADAAIFLFFHRAGEFTMHELRLARETFLAGKKPNVFVFFKAVDNAPDTCEEIRRCVDVVFNDFGHYYKTFADVDTVKLLVSVPQKNYSAAAASNYTARLDLGLIQTTGEQTLEITAIAANAAQYGTVLEVYDPEVTVKVEEYSTQTQVPVEVRLTGEMPENYYGGALSRSADAVDISGPASVVEKAARCVVDYDQSNLSPERSPNAVNLPFYFEDAEGNLLDDSALTVTPHGQSTAIQRITVRQEV